jgi:hypothetical protein
MTILVILIARLKSLTLAEYSFESLTSGTSGVSEHDSGLLDFDHVNTLHDMTPVPDLDICSKEMAAQQLLELSLDMNDIQIAEGNLIEISISASAEWIYEMFIIKYCVSNPISGT